jgi:hypothetical protein
MSNTRIRPGLVPGSSETSPIRLVAYFRNAAQGNSMIQLLGTMGIPASGLGVTTPDRLPSGQGMVLSIPCKSAEQRAKVESSCRAQGADLLMQP